MTLTPTPFVPASRYHGYLVRLWQDGPQTPWRATTHCVQTGEKRRFATLAALFAFLQEQTAGEAANDAGEPNLAGPTQAQPAPAGPEGHQQFDQPRH